jgi:hypothetical protein
MPKNDFLAEAAMVRYKAPKKIGNDRNAHAIANLKFTVLTEHVEGPAQLVRWIEANEKCLGSVSAKNDFDMEGFSLEFSDTPGTAVFLTIPHVTIKNFRLQKNADSDVFDLAFDAQVEADKSNAEFICLWAGRDVALRVVQTEEDQLWLKESYTETPIGEVAADPEIQAEVAEQLPLGGEVPVPKKPRRSKPGEALPRQLGGQRRKPLPKPKDKKRKV